MKALSIQLISVAVASNVTTEPHDLSFIFMLLFNGNKPVCVSKGATYLFSSAHENVLQNKTKYFHRPEKVCETQASHQPVQVFSH